MNSDFQNAMQALKSAIAEHDELTTDDVWPYFKFPPLERNVVGKAFAEANRQGLIKGTERFVKSTRPEAKGRRVQVWRAVR